MALSEENDRDVNLHSLKLEDVLGKLDLSGSGLEDVKAAAERGDRDAALTALLAFYRAKYPLSETKAPTGNFETADKVVKRVLQWGPYEEADYGQAFDWEWDPRGDIEWVASVYRFYWAAPLVSAYEATRDEKYARAFVEMTQDWIAKHPLEDRHRVHPVYTYWKGYVWLDIQTGIRATNLCKAFRVMVHGETFTPEFLGVFLASMYDHQVKTEALPMGRVHNKAIFEQRGFINIAYTFQEFKECKRWMELAFQRARENFLAQTTADGVQREWSYGYHNGVLNDAVEIQGRMESLGISVPEDYQDRIRKMYDYIFAVATPDLGAPMFGDGSRPLKETEDRSRWPLYSALMGGTELLGDEKYEARAKLDRKRLPGQKSYAFCEAGMYVMRNDWGPDQVHLGLHCSPLAISAHDQPDNGTFELYAYGRWLMPDTGFYVYGQDNPDREWHRQTRVHQTLTLDGKDSRDAGRQLLWHSSDRLDALVVENESYEGLVHRRSVWFVDRKFFVLLDEAVGKAEGELDLHFQFAPGPVRFDAKKKQARTEFEDANVLVWTPPNAEVELVEEEGWFAWKYGSRKSRKAFCYRHKSGAPAVFLTVLAPYPGTEAPEVSAKLVDGFEVGADRASLEVEAFGKRWEIGRDLKTGEAWCRR